MVVYEVNLDVNADVFAAYRAWLDEHIGSMLALPGFVGAEVFERRDPPPPEQQRSACSIASAIRPSSIAICANRRRACAPTRRRDSADNSVPAAESLFQPEPGFTQRGASGGTFANSALRCSGDICSRRWR
jgi:hypothetical protein